ncbi:MAG: class I SAM-dependent methyltransferase [Candidatus Micrarchaeota archaeon]
MAIQDLSKGGRDVGMTKRHRVGTLRAAHVDPPMHKRGANPELDGQLRALHEDRRRTIDKLVAESGMAQVARSYSKTSMADLFDEWAGKNYDGHMKEHDEAIRRLLKLLVAVHASRMDTSKTNIFTGRTLEMSCGTGTVIESIVTGLGEVDPEAIARLRIIANDISTGMQAEAKRKLAELGIDVEYTQQDFRELRLDAQIHMAILSQTLHLIADPVMLLRENEYGDPPSDHRRIKTRVIQEIFKKLEEHGYFVLIDEWPAKLSRKRGQNALDPAIEVQFDENFRPVESKSDLRDRIMSNVTGARFVAEFKLRIDAYHSMSLMVYEKDPAKLKQRQMELPSTETEAARAPVRLARVQIARRLALEKILATYKMVDEVFVDCYTPINGEAAVWKSVRKINGGEIFDTRTDGIQIDPANKYDTVIVACVLHNMEPAERETFVRNAIESLKPGGAIVFVDEWAPPSTSTNPIAKRDLRNTLIEQHQANLIFEGALRQGIIPSYGNAYYLYGFRKKN